MISRRGDKDVLAERPGTQAIKQCNHGRSFANNETTDAFASLLSRWLGTKMGLCNKGIKSYTLIVPFVGS